MSWAAVIAAGGAVAGGLISKSGSKGSATATQQNQVDPRIGDMLFGGSNGNGPQAGLLNRFQGYLDTPQSDASKTYATSNGAYLANYGGDDLNYISNTAKRLMGGNQAQLAGVPDYAKGSMVDAPSQNNMDLSGSYDRFINGTPGANPYLDQSINGAIAQNKLGFDQLQDDSTRNLMQNIMPSIRSNSVLAGQYGGSRQGIAEGNAIGQQQTELARAASQFGQNATNAAVGAKANAYETDSNRALSATQGLGAQQYGVAQQDAATKNAAEFMNVGNTYDVSKTNAAMVNGMTSQNNSAAVGGAGLMSGLLGQVSGTVNAQDNYGIGRAQGVAGLMAPFVGANSSSTSTQPLYQNTAGNAVGGAAAALGLYNQYKQANTPSTAGGMQAGTGSNGGGAGTWWNGYAWVPVGS